MLRHAKLPKTYTIDRILKEEYGYSYQQATNVKDFLLPMLEYDVDQRADAWHMLMTAKWLWTDDDVSEAYSSSKEK